MNVISQCSFQPFADSEDEYLFEGRGYQTNDTYWQPGDSEMEILTCYVGVKETTPWSYSTVHGGRRFFWRSVDLEQTIGRMAVEEKLTTDQMEDKVIQALWDNAEHEEWEGPDHYGE